MMHTVRKLAPTILLLLALTVAVLASGCSHTTPPVPEGWAASVAKAPDHVPRSCDDVYGHKLSEPGPGAASKLETARLAAKHVNEFGRLKKDATSCATWAKRQR